MLRSTIYAALLLVCGALTGCAQTPLSSATQADTVETGTVTGDIGAPRNRARIHTELASAYFERGNMGVALEELRVAVDADPTYAPAFNVLGLVHMDLRENAVAQQHFERALRLSPNDPDINNNYGWFLCQSGREEQSIAYFLAALKNPLYSTPARSYVNAGLCAIRKNNERDAFDYFQRALRSEPDNLQALLNLASIQYKRGQLELARGFIGRFNKLVEPTADSLWLALRIERKLGDKSAENTLATQLRRRFSGSQEYQDMLKGKFE
ncbi:MAG: type IV pilus biogenesis/stability protein PilW [Betaproteobacteria bacterium]|nr:MAG: type IV pilus biogenesis/stability protein PilW [Betaproteobacteria bacterium]